MRYPLLFLPSLLLFLPNLTTSTPTTPTTTTNPTTAFPTGMRPLLFMDTSDIMDTWGLLYPKVNPLTPISPATAATPVPPPLNYHSGAEVIAVLPSLDAADDAAYEVYVWNTTQPIASPSPSPPIHPHLRGMAPGLFLRYTTSDFVSYSAPTVALNSSAAIKSLDRNLATGEYVLLVYLDDPGTETRAPDAASSLRFDHGAVRSFISRDNGRSFQGPANNTGFHSDLDKDDSNIIFVPTPQAGGGYFADLQISWQNWTMPFCDNNPTCHQRRIVSAKLSTDGVNFTPDLGLRTPDLGLDPPELQFYRIRPFWIGDSGRLAAHVLLYAPAPCGILPCNGTYGRFPPNCHIDCVRPGTMCCHGPHMHTTLWVGPPSNRPELVGEWRRPFRLDHAAPSGLALMGQPVLLGNQHIFFSAGQTLAVPAYRLAGIYSPSNAAFSSPPFALPHTPSDLVVNVAAAWGARLVTGACDSGCAAYLYAELIDPGTQQPFPGFDKTAFRLIMNQDGVLPLLWDAGQHPAPPPGTSVQVRFYFRDAVVYSLGSK